MTLLKGKNTLADRSGTVEKSDLKTERMKMVYELAKGERECSTKEDIPCSMCDKTLESVEELRHHEFVRHKVPWDELSEESPEDNTYTWS